MGDRETKVPVTRIRKLIRMKKDLDDEVRNIMATYNVDMGYIRGLMKMPTQEPVSKKKATPKKKAPPQPESSTPRKQKKYIDRSDLIE